MHLEAGMILLLCCGAVAVAAAVRDDDVDVMKNDTALQDDVAVADDDAVPQDDVASLLNRGVVLEQRTSGQDSATPEGQEDLKNRMLLDAIQDAFARWGTPKCSDNGGPLMQVLGQISQRVTEMGDQLNQVLKKQTSAAEPQVVESRTNAKLQALITQTTSELLVLKAVTTAELQVVKAETTAELQVLKARTAADLKAVNEETAAELLAMKKQIAELKAVNAQTAADLLLVKTETAELKAVNAQTAADLLLVKTETAELKAVNAQTAADLLLVKTETAELKAVNAQTAADLLLVKTETAADFHTLQILTGQQGEAMQAARETDRQQEKAIQDARTSTYVRWGNSGCGGGGGNASGLVYSGVMGGGWWDSTGSAVNQLCMTRSPVMSQRDPPPYPSHLYGIEYETYDSHLDKNALCAVCSAAFSTTVMIPGTDTCSPGWSLQYSGYIMSGYHTHKSGTHFICVDGAMESTPNSATNHNGALLYYTTAQCGSLPCGPYVQDQVVTCAVCSQ